MIARIVYGSGLVLAVFAVVAVAFAPSVLQAAGDFLVIRDPLDHADAVIAISGDGTGERVAAAAAVVERGYAQWLILSGSTAGFAPGGATAALYRRALRLGISEDRILVDDESTSTTDNARHVADLMQQHDLWRAILVTSPYHTRRAAVLFRREFLPRGLTLRVYAAERSFFDVERWWTRPFDRALVLHEYAKLFGLILLRAE